MAIDLPFYLDKATARAIKKYPHRALDIVNSFSENQYACKVWLYEELSKCQLPQQQIVYVAGSWYGHMIVPLLQDIFPFADITLQDMDFETIKIARNIYFPDDDQVKCDVMDCQQFLYNHMVVNTSCEHMNPLQCDKGTHVVLQSNNYTEVEDHINCVASPEELADQYKVSHILYKGTLQRPNYERYMVIGLI